MKLAVRSSLAFALLGALLHTSAMAQSKSYVVRFKDAAVPQVKAGSVRDERLASDPEHWSYVGERVMGHLQSLEKRYQFKADAAFGTVFMGMSVRLTPAQLQSLRNDASVDAVEEDQVYSVQGREVSDVQAAGRVTGGTSSTTQVIPWGISKTLATQSYTIAGNGSGAISGVRAYIIDTGLDTKNTDLNRMGHINFTGDGRNTDCSGHGTHVSGTVAAYDNTAAVVGMGPGVAVYGVKVLNCQGSGSTSAVIQGIDWVAANAVLPAVANMSLGGGASPLLDDAVRNAAAKGIVFSIAAGNSATDACTTSPARVGGGGTAGVMTVAATDSSDLEASFSNYGSCVDIWAPGVNVTSLKLGGGTTVMSGTSMASPHVGGAAALYLGRYPMATSASVVSALKGMMVTTGTLSQDGRAVQRLKADVQ